MVAKQGQDANAPDLRIVMQGVSDLMMAEYERRKRDKVERTALPARSSLRALLKTLPAHWLEAMTDALDLGAARRRVERESAIASAVLDPGKLEEVVYHRLGATERDALDSILLRRGEYKLANLRGRFGSDDEDGWFWKERPPTSPIGRLRQHALVFVGTRTIKGRRHRMAVVPEELREPLGRLSAGRWRL